MGCVISGANYDCLDSCAVQLFELLKLASELTVHPVAGTTSTAVFICFVFWWKTCGIYSRFPVFM